MPDPKYVPPSGGRCLIEKLIPNELLAYIFRLGTQAQVEDEHWFIEEDDGDENFEDVDSDEEEDEEKEESVEGETRTRTYDATDPEEGNPMWMYPFQVRISHVCRRWRQIATDLPLLWSSIRFTDNPHFEESKLWITRSKDVPLDISIDIPPYLKEPDTDNEHDDETEGDEDEDADSDPKKEGVERLRQILDIAVPLISRWESFDLSVMTWEQMYVALTRLAQCPAKPGAPLLKSLSLYCDEDTGYEHFLPEGSKAPKLLFGGHVPRLEQLGLWSVHLDWSLLLPRSTHLRQLLQTPSAESPGATTNLKELELAFHAKDVRPTFEQFVAITKHAPKLEALKLSCSGPYFSQDYSPRDRIIIPSLDTLMLSSQSEAYVIQLIRALYVPNLTNLTLDLADQSFSEFVGALVEPVKRPFELDIASDPRHPSLDTQSTISRSASILSKLTSLKLSGLMCEDAQCALLYEKAPRVTDLYLNMRYLPDPFLSSLITKRAPLWQEITPEMLSQIVANVEKEQPLLPELKTLTIGGTEGDTLVALVASRRAARVPLRELNVDHSISVKLENWEYLRQNVEETRYVILSDDEGWMSDDEEDEEEDGGDGDDQRDAEDNEGTTQP